MRKLNWKQGDCHPKDKYVFFGGMHLDCSYEEKQWCSYASFLGRSQVGELFDSLKEAQEDCVRLAQQLLAEYHTHLARIMKSFDVDCDEI